MSRGGSNIVGVSVDAATGALATAAAARGPDLRTRASAGIRVGITQRRKRMPVTGGELDSLDETWDAWFQRALPGAIVFRVPNAVEDVAHMLDHAAIDVLMLSGGEDVGSSPLRDATEQAALDHAIRHRLPVVGVCRGMQFLHVASGGSLVAVTTHVGVAHDVIARDGKRVAVNSWHRWGIRALPPQWDAIACCDDDATIEAFRHRVHPWLGVMAHPERDGGDVVSQWVVDFLEVECAVPREPRRHPRNVVATDMRTIRHGAV